MVHAKRRRPVGVIVLVVLLVGGLIAAAAVVLVPRVLDKARWSDDIEPIAEFVEKERGLDFEESVDIEFLSESAYEKQITGEDDAPPGLAEEDAEGTVGMLRALGLVHGEVDLSRATDDLASNGTLAFYTPDEKRIYVRGTKLTPIVRATLAHELTHALQDQHFDLKRLGDPDFDRADELRAMVEGDASLVESAYVGDGLTDAEREEYEAETESGIGSAEQELAATVPPALIAFFASPYYLGPLFLIPYVESGDWDEVNDLIRNPPTEEELLDPAVRDTPRAEMKDVDVDAPRGADVIVDDTLGPVALYLMLASRDSPPDAVRALDAWGGDHLVAYRQDGKVCASVAIAADDTTGADTLHAALIRWAAKSPRGSVLVTRRGDRVDLRACDPGAAAPATGVVSPDLLLVPGIRSIFRGAVIAGGADADLAACMGDRLMEVFTPDDVKRFDELDIDDELEEARDACS